MIVECKELLFHSSHEQLISFDINIRTQWKKKLKSLMVHGTHGVHQDIYYIWYLQPPSLLRNRLIFSKKFLFEYAYVRRPQLPSKPISALMTFRFANELTKSDFIEKISIHASNFTIVFTMHNTFPWNIYEMIFNFSILNPITIYSNFCNVVKINLFFCLLLLFCLRKWNLGIMSVFGCSMFTLFI